jgi:hypothetical protein
LSCPAIDHLACRLPGDLEPLPYNVPFQFSIAAGLRLPGQAVDIANQDAPFHIASITWAETTTTGSLLVRIYDAAGRGQSAVLLRAPNVLGSMNITGQLRARPEFPSIVFPINSVIQFDLENIGAGTSAGWLLFRGYKVFERGKSPC